MHKAKIYVVEFNRPRGDSILTCASRLTKQSLSVSRAPHLTKLVIERPSGFTWPDFKVVIRASLQQNRGSSVIMSCNTGRVFVCSNRGNRPGKFQIVAQP